MVKNLPSNAGDAGSIPGWCLPGYRASQVVLVVKNPPGNAGGIRDVGSIPGLGRSPGGGNGNSL